MPTDRPRDGRDEPPTGGTGRNAQADFQGKRRRSDTRANTTDPDARLYRKGKGQPAISAYQGHVLMENRSGLAASAVVAHADGFGERAAAQAMLDTMPGKRRRTLGADKAYDTHDFVAANEARQGGSAIDERTRRHRGYQASQVIRKRIEEYLGWGKTVGRIRQTVYRGLRRVDRHFKLAMTAANLVRIARMLGAAPQGAAQ